MNLKEFAEKKSILVSGHKSCSGCGFPTIFRHVLAGTNNKVVITMGTSCSVVVNATYPHSSWVTPNIHSVFANSGATMSGMETAYRHLKKNKKIKEDVKFLALIGDGGTYDIGLQALSGAIERNHDFLYVCYDNESYMNTGGQRSSATRHGTSTTTTPEGIIWHGKPSYRKNLTEIIACHDIPYAAQATTWPFGDLVEKARKGFEVKGPAFLNVLSPCVLFWGINTGIAVKLSKLAMQTCFWPSYEVINGEHKLTYKPKHKLPVTEFLKHQKRFKHLMKQENKQTLKELQERIDLEWQALLKKCGEKEL
ncbi:MAG: thiamine pyrophosphate-dependent enzyme [archaeon]